MSVGFNVFRYSALAGGILYGAVHRYNLESSHKQAEFTKKWNEEEKLIRQAKKQYAQLTAPKSVKVEQGSINWEDPNLDLAKVLEAWIAKLD